MSKKKSFNNARTRKNIFLPYWSNDEVVQGLEKSIIKGTIRLNPRNYKEAYITHLKLDSDVLIYDKHINRALYDDIVAVQLHKKYDWKVLSEINSFDIDITNIINSISLKNSVTKMGDSSNKTNDAFLTIKMLLDHSPSFFAEKLCWNMTDIDLSDNNDFPDYCENWWKYFQRTGQVVAIIHRMNSRVCVGSLCMPDITQTVKYARFIPTDIRYPRLLVSLSDCPPDFVKRPKDYTNIKFIAGIGEWSETNPNPKGYLNQCLANMSMIDQEIAKILAECGLEDHDFPNNILDSVPAEIMTDDDLKYRRDMRSQCVFSIDPKTARDLDDALHIRELPSENGEKMWEVGVHIADVTYYVTPDTALDDEASKRATTVYMVHKAIPMLPRELCENLCSLHPGSDKLAYSVIYKMTDHCEIVDVWIGRTVIRSACQLSYDDAQMVLDNPTKTDWVDAEFGKIFPPFKASDIANSILKLNHLATQMRHTRFENGALWLNHPKIGFVLNADRNIPLGYNTYQLASSNHLIEEWMLRANMTVAEFLHKHLPRTAFLRCHPGPTAQAIQNINKQFEQMGWHECHLQTGSTEEFQGLMDRCQVGRDENQLVTVNIFNKAMQLALYFCNKSDCDSDEFLDKCRHFALNVPLYTHFTSPIRRYPDVIVHRQITQILMKQPNEEADKLTWMARTSTGENVTADFLSYLAQYCNKKKKDAKAADDSSIMLFYSLFVEKSGPFTENGIVMGLLDKSFDVLLANCGFTKRVYVDQLDASEAKFDVSQCKLIIVWNVSPSCAEQGHPAVCTIVSPMSSVTVVVSAVGQGDNAAPKLKFVICHPGCGLCDVVSGIGGMQLRHISSMQSEMNIVDVDTLYNILDDI